VPFDETELEDALELHRRSYQLIVWVGSAIQRGFIPFEHAHQQSTALEAAEAWLAHHYLNLPVDARPIERSGPQLRRYANFFVSYLQVSFELNEFPGSRLVSPNACFCSFCSSLESASHLKAKKLRPKDKEHAQKLKLTYMTTLARETGRELGPAEIDGLLQNHDLGHDAALATYANELLSRSRGVRSSPAVLALWRELAWTEHGSPNHKFRLRKQDILKAERNLLTAFASTGT
jgi:hypothetical protein